MRRSAGIFKYLFRNVKVKKIKTEQEKIPKWLQKWILILLQHLTITTSKHKMNNKTEENVHTFAE